MKFLGAGLVACGIMLFIWARRVLGASFSGHVSVQQGQELVQSGPYRFLRHPAYAGYLMMAIGIGLGYSSLVGLVSVLVVLVPVLMVRIRVEERILAAHFDNQWQDYARSVPVLLPRLKRRK